MSEAKTTKLAIGDEVRVHFHPPGTWKSFSEGVVRRVDVTTQAGRFFVLEVRNDIKPENSKHIFIDVARHETILPSGISCFAEHAMRNDGTALEPVVFDQPQIVGSRPL